MFLEHQESVFALCCKGTKRLLSFSMSRYENDQWVWFKLSYSHHLVTWSRLNQEHLNPAGYRFIYSSCFYIKTSSVCFSSWLFMLFSKTQFKPLIHSHISRIITSRDAWCCLLKTSEKKIETFYCILFYIHYHVLKLFKEIFKV